MTEALTSDPDAKTVAQLTGIAKKGGFAETAPHIAVADLASMYGRSGRGEEAAEPVVRGAGLQHLAVRGLVGDERDLGEDDAEACGDEQLEPAVAEQERAHQQADEGDAERDHDADVEADAALEQAGVADGLRDDAEVGALGAGGLLARRDRGAQRSCGRRGGHCAPLGLCSDFPADSGEEPRCPEPRMLTAYAVRNAEGDICPMGRAWTR